ncbi:site-2 protease family protein [Candidatus Daviesbacteria bacterium]|nr:site-2 protease family protein [Candidatus Daviesbacteria bacterium]
MIITVIIFILTLLFLVVIHELGHFLLAKKFGIKVEEFGFGIPPRAWGKKIGETLVSLNWLPFGGFVKLLGEDETDRQVLESKRSFASQTVGKRITVVVAGVVMNLILAWILLYATLFARGFKTELPLLLEHNFWGVNQQNEVVVIVRGINKNSPADIAGIKDGERVIAINNEFIKSAQDLIDKTKSLSAEKTELTLSDADKTKFRMVVVTPRVNPPEGEGPLGISLAQFQLANLAYQTLPQKILSGPIHATNIVVYSGKIFGRLIGQAFQAKSVEPLSHSVSGPVGITSLVNDILTQSQNPLISYLDFMALLSLNLAVLNILPFPALDGGRLFFLLIEAITRKRVHQDVERWVHTVGMAILLTLMMLVTFSDIRKLFP